MMHNRQILKIDIRKTTSSFLCILRQSVIAVFILTLILSPAAQATSPTNPANPANPGAAGEEGEEGDEDKTGDTEKNEKEYSPQTPGYTSDSYKSSNDSPFFESCGGGGGECCEEGGSVELEGKDNVEKILNFFMAKGLSLAQAAGIVGNMVQESGVGAGTREDIQSGKGGPLPIPNPAAVQNKTESAPDDYKPQDGVGFGLVQWTFTARQAPLVERAKGEKITDLTLQLEYVWDELNGTQPVSGSYKHSLDAIKASDDPVKAAIAAHGPPNPGYEASADSAEEVRRVRGGNAKNIYDFYKDKAPAGNMKSSSSGATTSKSGDSGGGKAVIALDAGHSVPAINDVDDETGATLSDYSNDAEVNDMWEVTQMVKEGLEKEGYTVKMIRETKEERVNFKERAERASGAALALSIHSTPPGKSEVFYQFTGASRTGPKAKKTFDNEEVASKSKQYAEASAKARSEVEDNPVTIGKVNFNGRGGGIAPGDIPWVQLFASDTPWIYHEFTNGGRGGVNALTEQDKSKYAEGIIAGVVAANPQGGDTGADCGSSGDTKGIGETALKYAWTMSEQHSPTDPKKAWGEYVKDAPKNGLYVGGISYPGIDCGGWTTGLITLSGWDPTFNSSAKLSEGAGPTGAQEAWMKKNWKKIGDGPQDPAKLQPGDIAINDGHTFAFVGDVPGFGHNIASASLDSRAPEAGGDDANESGYNWYRKK